jgi:hypothetical protein
MTGACVSSRARKTATQTRVHPSKGGISCKGIGCGKVFFPKRKDQVFCSPNCRTRYFESAREIGIILLEKGKRDPTLRVFIDKLLKEKNGRTPRH